MSFWKALRAFYDSSNTADVRIDASTSSLQVVDYEHHEIHSGSRYFYSETVDIAGSGTRDILIVTPDTTKWAHFTLPLQISSNKQTTVSFYEDTTTSADGTGLTEQNFNRNSVKTATVVVTHTPTVSGVGTLLIDDQFGESGGFFTGDVGGQATGGRAEIILKQNAKYLLRITNNDGSASDVNIWLDWYEHTDHN